jgi:hypothetical protein
MNLDGVLNAPLDVSTSGYAGPKGSPDAGYHIRLLFVNEEGDSKLTSMDLRLSLLKTAINFEQ